jgi:SAM-dependent methyltransferase
MEEIARAVPDLRAMRVLEAGSGSGRICARLADRGSSVCLLDLSERALHLARRFLDGRPAGLVLADISGLPFLPRTFDVIFSSGVMEHWSEQEQRDVLREVARITSDRGVFLAFNPYARSGLYRLGKVVLEALKLWPYGHENPVTSLAGAAGDRWRVVDEHSMAFLAILVNSFRLLPGLRVLDKPLQRLAVEALDSRAFGGMLRGLDRFLSRHLGGYLLVSILAKAPA